MKNIEKESYINTFLIIDQFASNSLSEKKVFSMMKRSAPEMFDSDDWTQLMVNHGTSLVQKVTHHNGSNMTSK